VASLDFDPNRPPVPPRPASTLVLLRDARDGVEVVVMQRSLQSSFMGGAIVFPGGRLEAHDARAEWPEALVTRDDGPWWDDEGFAARVAGCREALEEVSIAPVTGGPLAHAEAETLRKAAAEPWPAWRDQLATLGRRLDLASLVPLARWVTPEAESRRFDARFFIARAPEGQEGVMDEREAIRTFWARPATLLDDWEHGRVSLFPPTHRTLEQLAAFDSVDAALASARGAALHEICPRFVLDEGVPTLALPGDPLHAVKERRSPGGSRFVLRGDRWIPTDPG
jgi:hypothetical protein